MGCVRGANEGWEKDKIGSDRIGVATLTRCGLVWRPCQSVFGGFVDEWMLIHGGQGD